MARGRRKFEEEEDQAAMKIRLKYVQAFYVGGSTYYYFRKRGAPRTRLPGAVGSREFMDVYGEALAAAPSPIGKEKRSGPGSISVALVEYFASRTFTGLADGTRGRRKATLERFREECGHKLLASLPREFVVALLDGLAPHAAKNW